jgi:Cys-tRNA(Pro)/Cys-tRNA(Cys) deacylase
VARKTNAVRRIESAGVEYELREYDLSLEEFTAEGVAELIGLPAGQVFKTLVVEGDRNGPCFAVVPADAELDLKALARVSGDRRTAMMALKDVEPMTGYRRGGVTALGARKELPVYLDLSAADHSAIGVSAGVKGLQVVLAPDDYVALTGAELASIIRR